MGKAILTGLPLRADEMMDASLSLDEILAQLASAQSKIAYDKVWNRFMAFLTTGDTNKDGGNLREITQICGIFSPI